MVTLSATYIGFRWHEKMLCVYNNMKVRSAYSGRTPKWLGEIFLSAGIIYYSGNILHPTLDSFAHSQTNFKMRNFCEMLNYNNLITFVRWWQNDKSNFNGILMGKKVPLTQEKKTKVKCVSGNCLLNRITKFISFFFSWLI